MKDDRDAQAGMLDEKLLDGIGQLSIFLRVFSFTRVAGPADLSDTMALFETGLRFFQIEVPIGIKESFRFLLPDTHHLRGFFLKGHAAEQVMNALLDWQSRVFVRKQFGWFWL